MGISGNFSTVGLPDVLQLLASGVKTGTLMVKKNNESTAIYFQEGNIVYAKSTTRRNAILDILVRESMLDPQRAEKIRERAKHKRKSPERILQESGEIDRNQLLQASMIHSKEVVYELFQWLEGEFEFHEGELPPDDFANFTVSLGAYNLIMEGARRIDEWSRIRKTIPSMESVFKLEGEPDASKIQFNKDEWQILALIDGFRTVREIGQEAGKSEFEVCRILYGLKSAGLLKPVKDSSAETIKSGSKEKKKLYAILAGSGIIIMGLLITVLVLLTRSAPPAQMPEATVTPILQSTPVVSDGKTPDSIAATKIATEVSAEPIYEAITTPNTPVPETPGPQPTETPQEMDTQGQIDLNTANSERLQTLPRIGPATAEKIIRYRQTHGGFSAPSDIMKVRGIGLKTFESMQTMIYCSDSTPPQIDLPEPEGDDQDTADTQVSIGTTVNINTAGQDELTTLPGIGPSKATLIMEYRDTNGPFATPEDLMNVKGIGPKTFERMKSMIVVK